jgi:hypothetical protein
MTQETQQRPYAKRVGLPGYVELGFDAGSLAVSCCCFLEYFSGWRERDFIKILRRRIGHRSRDVLRWLSSGPNFWQFDRSVQVVRRDSEFPLWGGGTEPCGQLTVPLRTPGGIEPLHIHVVPQNLPRFGADLLDAQQWYIRNVSDELVATACWTTDCTMARALLLATRFR